MKPNNIIPVKCTRDSFYRAWMEFLSPFHNLTPREMDVAARILQQYFKLSASIKDKDTLEAVLWHSKSRTDMRESLGMSPAHFQIVLAKLRSIGFLQGDSINSRFIPHLTDDPRFMLCIVYDWSTPEHAVNG